MAPRAIAGLKAPPEMPPTANAPDHHRESDREAVKGVSVGAARGRNVEDDPREREGEQELRDQHLAAARDERVGFTTSDVAHDEAGDHRGDALRDHVGTELVRQHSPAQEYGSAHGGVEMAARDVPAREHHHHQDRPDRQRRERTRACLVRRHPHREHEQEYPDELHY